MQRSLIAASLALMLAAPLAVNAQSTSTSSYVKLGVGQARADIDTWGHDTDTAASLAYGVQVNPNFDVEVGYMGGQTQSPSYEAVCSGNTGHAEVARIHFDESLIPADVVLDIFFTIHDPRQLNRQGEDIGTQYR